jgi:hypothetical protein
VWRRRRIYGEKKRTETVGIKREEEGKIKRINKETRYKEGRWSGEIVHTR